MRTPGNDFELAAGFLHNEGVIRSLADLRGISYCLDAELDPAQQYNVVNVDLAASEAAGSRTAGAALRDDERLRRLREGEHRGLAPARNRRRHGPRRDRRGDGRRVAGPAARGARRLRKNGRTARRGALRSRGEPRRAARGCRPPQRARQANRLGVPEPALAALRFDRDGERPQQLRARAEGARCRRAGAVRGFGTEQPRRRCWRGSSA